jgi:RimJ/RimL family protein N-acetyltransferase
MLYLETSRLQLRDWEESDLEPFTRLNEDEKVLRYFPKSLSNFTPCIEIGWRLKKHVL